MRCIWHPAPACEPVYDFHLHNILLGCAHEQKAHGTADRCGYAHVMRTRKMLISHVKLDHMLYSINYGTSI